MSSLSLKPKVADRINYQQPEFIQRDHETLIKFLEEYYRFLEQDNGSLNIIRKTVDNIDVDETTEQFLDLIKQNVFPASLSNIDTVIDERELVKYLRELYLTKGSEASFDFVMKNIYGNDSELTYGKKFVFRTSDNEYLGTTEVIVKNLPGDTTDLTAYIGYTIYQPESTATAIVDDIILEEPSVVRGSIIGDVTAGQYYIYNVSILNDIKVGDIIGYEEYSTEADHHHYHLGTSLLFPQKTRVVSISGTTIRVDAPANLTSVDATLFYKTPYFKCILDRTSVKNEFDGINNINFISRESETVEKIVGAVTSVTHIDISYNGSLYSTNTKIKVLDGSGSDTVLKVGEVSAGPIDSALILDGGTGYSIGDVFEVQSKDGRGAGAQVEVTGVDGSGAILQPVLKLTGLTLDPIQSLNYQIGDVITLDIPDRFGISPELVVSSIAGGTGLDKHWLIKTNSPGAMYRLPLKVSIFDSSTLVQNVEFRLDAYSGIEVTQITPNTTWTAPTIMVGGAGAHGTVTIVNKTITAFTITSGGLNYFYGGLIDIFADALFETDIIGSQPLVYFTNNVNGTITNIAINSGGRYDVVDGTYYFKVREPYGSGVDLEMVNYTHITGYTITYAGEYIVDPKLINVEMTTDGVGYPWLGTVEYDLDKIDIIHPGRMYTDPTLTLTGGSETPPTVTLATSPTNSIFRINVLNGGTGYVDATVVIDGDGTGATATANINGGIITSITVSNPGNQYINAYAMITSDTGAGALLEAELVRVGGIISATIV